MSRSSLQNVLALPDAFQTWNFDLFFPSIPGATDTTPLTYKCQTSALPGFNLEPITIDLHGVTKKEAGRATYNHTFQSNFLEVADMSTRLAFRNWREACRSWKLNTGSVSSAYKVNGQIVTYDNTGAAKLTIVCYGMWPETVEDLSLEGNQSVAGMLGVTFSYDYTDETTS